MFRLIADTALTLQKCCIWSTVYGYSATRHFILHSKRFRLSPLCLRMKSRSHVFITQYLDQRSSFKQGHIALGQCITLPVSRRIHVPLMAVTGYFSVLLRLLQLRSKRHQHSLNHTQRLHNDFPFHSLLPLVRWSWVLILPHPLMFNRAIPFIGYMKMGIVNKEKDHY